MSVLVKMLSHHHGLTHREAQFAGSFLLKGTGGEGRCGVALLRFLLNILYHKLALLADLQESQHFVVCLEAGVELSLHLTLRTIGIRQSEDGADTVVGLTLEVLDLAFTLNDESNGNALYTTGRQGGFHLSPKHGRELEANKAVEYTTGLLCVHQVHVQMTRVLDSSQNGRLGNLVENDTVGFLFIQSEHFAKVP